MDSKSSIDLIRRWHMGNCGSHEVSHIMGRLSGRDDVGVRWIQSHPEKRFEIARVLT